VAGYSLDTSSTLNLGPIKFGSTTSGGNVVFGSSSPGLTAAATNLTSNPWVLGGLALVALAALWIWRRK
jgi:hypothetical protein